VRFKDEVIHSIPLLSALQVKVNLQGEIVDRGSTNLGVNMAGFNLHSAVYAARPDVKCVVHIHTAAGAAVSASVYKVIPPHRERRPGHGSLIALLCAPFGCRCRL